MDWEAAFVPAMPMLEVFVRGTVMYLAIVLALRVVGRREAGGVGVTDVLVIVLLGQAVGGGLIAESTAVVDGLLLVATILFWGVVVDALAYQFPRFSKLVKAQPRMLISDRGVNRRVSRRELLTDEEIQTQLRLHGIEDLREVRHAYLEPNGMISVIRVTKDQPAP